MAQQAKRYLAVFRLSVADKRAQALLKLLSRFADGDVQLAFNSPDALVFGILFKASTPPAVIRAEIDKATTNTDCFLVCEAGDFVAHKGLGVAATWLQRR